MQNDVITLIEQFQHGNPDDFQCNTYILSFHMKVFFLDKVIPWLYSRIIKKLVKL